MISLARSASLIKKLIPLIVTVVVIGFLVFLIFLRLGEEKEDQKFVAPVAKLEKPNIKGPNIATEKFNTQNLNLNDNSPKTLPVYDRGQGANFLSSANTLSGKLSFTSPPIELYDVSVGKKLVFQSDGANLSIFENGFSHNKSSLDLPAEGQFKNIDELRSEAINFLAALGITPEFSQEYQVHYYQTAGEFERFTTKPQEANRLVIFFNYEIADIKVVGRNITVTASFNRQNQLIGIIFNQFKVGQEIGTYPLITSRKALGLLITGNGTLIDSRTQSDYSPLPKQVKIVNLDRVYIGYYQMLDNNKTIQPVWIFEGKSIVEDGEAFLTYAVPAVEKNYFLP